MSAQQQPDHQEMELEIEKKILHLLTIYPIISPTMLQAGLGPSTKPAIWRPLLNKLIANGDVVETSTSVETPTSRYNTYAQLQLPGTKVTLKSKRK